MTHPPFYTLIEPIKAHLHHYDGVLPATQLITAFAENTLQKHVDEALAEFGEAPAPWALILFGSEGRMEQTFSTDQDNAIIICDTAADNPEIIGWFQRFGQSINDKLNASGYKYCKGGIMAGNPRWCVPLQTWKQYFKSWILHPEPLAVMHSTIFFDMRHGVGSQDLTRELQEFLNKTLADRSEIFYYHLVQNALKVQIPPVMLRWLWLKVYDQQDLKHLSLPIIGAARIMALRNAISEQHTELRLRALRDCGHLRTEKAAELIDTFNRLTWLRLRYQIQAIEKGLSPDNIVQYKELLPEEKLVLNDALNGVLLARTMLRNAIGAYF